MKIQKTPNLQLNKKNQSQQSENASKVSFQGGEILSETLNFLATNQAWGAVGVDLGSMVIPRTLVDFSRGPAAGFETGRRESSSTVNHALVGIYGTGAALLFAQAMNNQYNIKAHKMFFNDEILDDLGQKWINNSQGKDSGLEKYLKTVFDDIQGFNPGKQSDDAKWTKIEHTETKENLVKRLTEEINRKPKEDKGFFKNIFTKNRNYTSLDKNAKEYMKALVVRATGAENKFKLSSMTNDVSLDDLLENIYKASKAFTQKAVAETFKSGGLKGNKFINEMKGLNAKASALGLAIPVAIGVSIQPFNMYLTKKKTGQSGFVGVEGREPDKTAKFKMLKSVLAVLGMSCALASIGNIRKPAEVFSKVKFKGLIPTLDQFKLIYGFTIASRILSARDKNELRETTTKDSLGFANWLLLGGIVSKLSALGFEKMDRFKNDKFVYVADKESKGAWGWIKHSNLVSRHEVLQTALKKAGVSTIKENGKAMNLSEMMKIAAKSAPDARKKVKYLELIQVIGYLYSGLVLGIGIPKLNIAITKHMEHKRKAKEQQTGKSEKV